MEGENEGVSAQGKFMLLLYMIFFFFFFLLAQNRGGPKTGRLLRLIFSSIFVIELIFLSLVYVCFSKEIFYFIIFIYLLYIYIYIYILKGSV